MVHSRNVFHAEPIHLTAIKAKLKEIKKEKKIAAISDRLCDQIQRNNNLHIDLEGTREGYADAIRNIVLENDQLHEEVHHLRHMETQQERAIHHYNRIIAAQESRLQTQELNIAELKKTIKFYKAVDAQQAKEIDRQALVIKELVTK
jgi:hypothetical protein